MLVHRTAGFRSLLDAVPLLRAAKGCRPDDELVVVAPPWLDPLVRHIGIVDRIVTDVPADATDVAELDLEVDPADRALLVPEVPPPAQADVVLHPGASDPERVWPASRWAIVAEQERDAGRRVVVIGTADEEDLAWQVAGLSGLGRKAMLVGETDVLQLLAVVGTAGRVLSGDTGVARLAWSVGTPSLVVASAPGPTPPAGPHVVVADESLHSVEADAVLDALEDLPMRRGPAGCP